MQFFIATEKLHPDCKWLQLKTLLVESPVFPLPSHSPADELVFHVQTRLILINQEIIFQRMEGNCNMYKGFNTKFTMGSSKLGVKPEQLKGFFCLLEKQTYSGLVVTKSQNGFDWEGI